MSFHRLYHMFQGCIARQCRTPKPKSATPSKARLLYRQKQVVTTVDLSVSPPSLSRMTLYFLKGALNCPPSSSHSTRLMRAPAPTNPPWAQKTARRDRCPKIVFAKGRNIVPGTCIRSVARPALCGEGRPGATNQNMRTIRFTSFAHSVSCKEISAESTG